MKDVSENENIIIKDLKIKIQVLENENTELLKKFDESIDNEIELINEYLKLKKKLDILQKKYNKINYIYLMAKKNKLIRKIYYSISKKTS